MQLEITGKETAIERGQKLRAGLAQAKPGEFLLPAGEYDSGRHELIIPAGITLKGVTPRGAVIKNQSVFRTPLWEKDAAGKWIVGADGKYILVRDANGNPVDLGASSAFVLSDKVILDGVVLESNCDLHEQSAVAGFGFDSPTPRTAIFRNSVLRGRAWGGYLWHADGDTFLFEGNNQIVAANIGIGMGRSTGVNAQVVRIDGNLMIIIDPTRSTQGGSVTNPLDGGSIGIAVRGGQLFVDGLTVTGHGQDEGRGPMLCAISDHLEGGLDSSRIYVYKLSTHLVPGKGTKILCDIDNQYDTVRMCGNGSAPNGGILVRSKVA